MSGRSQDWFSEIFADFNPERWISGWDRGPGRAGGRKRHRRRGPMFESGEMKYVILTLLREKPRHGYEVIKALEERMGGCYTPSPGTVYPTLQLLEDQGYVRAVDADGKKVYHITDEGIAFLEEHKDLVTEILDRVRDTLRHVAGGAMGELNEAVARLTASAYREAWRHGPDDKRTRSIVEILRRATEEICDRPEPSPQ